MLFRSVSQSRYRGSRDLVGSRVSVEFLVLVGFQDSAAFQVLVVFRESMEALGLVDFLVQVAFQELVVSPVREHQDFREQADFQALVDFLA